MKIRSDFVSNSSSCSFIVHDINAFKEKFKVLSSTKDGKDVDTLWTYGLNVSFNFKNTKENKKVFKDFIDGYTYTDGEWIYGSGDFEKFLKIDPQYYGQLDNFNVYAYNDCDNNDIQKLTLLYWAMIAEGVDIDNSTSEHEYEFFADLPTPLVNAAIKHFNQR